MNDRQRSEPGKSYTCPEGEPCQVIPGLQHCSMADVMIVTPIGKGPASPESVLT